MNREIVLRPRAEVETREAFEWYERQAPGLGWEFLRSVDASLQSIRRDPNLHPIVWQDVRRALVRRFPYQIFFVLEEKSVVVLAVLHAKRDPKNWPPRV